MKPAQATVNTWRTVFLKLKEDFPNHSAAMFTTAEIKTWLEGLITEHDPRIKPRARRSARTIRLTWIAAGKRVFGWAVDQKLVSKNPFADVRVPVPRRKTNRETKAFTDEEIETILRASSSASKTRLTKREATARWVPWLCAYTGARPGEITQLRGADVIEQNGVHAIRITPEAGRVMPDPQALRDRREHRALKVLLGRRDLRAHLDRKDLRAHQDQQDQPA
jgi:integrase